MPLLRRLREEGFAVWPFDDVRPGEPVVVEIYPRALTGPVNKSNRGEREAALGRLAPAGGGGGSHRVAADGPHTPISRDSMPRELRERAAASDDAFDALVSAMAMDAHWAELRSLSPGDETDRVEGRIWVPRLTMGLAPAHSWLGKGRVAAV